MATLNTATDYDAVCYFMSSYILSCPFQDYLHSLYPTCRLGKDDALSSAITTASFATFARRTGRRAYMDRAERNYGLALARINAALTDPATAVLDQTLASILLLATFEATIFPGARSPEEWTAHLLGATRLLQLRGLDQFQYETGRHLHNHITNNICASCMQRMVDLPAEFQAWCDKAGPFIDPKYHLREFSTILQKAVSFKARLWARLEKDRAVLYDLFYEAVALEQEASALMKDDNAETAYTIQPKESTPPLAYKDIAHHHKAPRAAKHQNTLRMVRLFMLEVMSAGASIATKEMYSQPDTIRYFESVKENAQRLSAEIATEVLGCVPDFLEPTSTFANPKFCPVARTLVWPLSVVYKNSICPLEARKYAKAMLDDLVKELNTLQLVDAGKMITKPGTMDDW
ncbi:hypothetical protein NA57DRAFT_70929 [Rhizodiscina lignyota]|uniref:C6 finger domain protein n=1 Tax=Rhizodiscina lignyota TaxID=1504668 RepID=A0A9P4IRD7_9PEZI|nr:hypothetical protein NA57DRAFT_70929 [Rhizodiscina lignyota]